MGKFTTHETFDNVQSRFCVITAGSGAADIWRPEVRDAAACAAVLRTAPAKKTFLVQISVVPGFRNSALNNKHGVIFTDNLNI